LDVLVLWISVDEPIAMAIRMDHDIHVVRIFVGCRRSVQRRFVETPMRRPLLSEYLRNAPSVGDKTCPAALDLEVPLIP
jgi:hypothetical protein